MGIRDPVEVVLDVPENVLDRAQLGRVLRLGDAHDPPVLEEHPDVVSCMNARVVHDHHQLGPEFFEAHVALLASAEHVRLELDLQLFQEFEEAVAVVCTNSQFRVDPTFVSQSADC